MWSGDVIEKIEMLAERALDELSRTGAEALEEWRRRYLGRSGELTALLRAVGGLPSDQRPEAGKVANKARDRLQNAYDVRQAALLAGAGEGAQAIDVTLPGFPQAVGGLHPTTETLREIRRIFGNLGFRAVDSPEVEWDEYNFEKLNMPPEHPARDMWDTFFLQSTFRPGEMLLRTHTSPAQARVMEHVRPPVRVIMMGKCYRYEDVDANHESMFHQVEGLAVDSNITMSDLRGVLEYFAREMFGPESRIRFRPSFFPFTEPSAEVDVLCFLCQGTGCRVCKLSGWLEILGSGMVHPEVLRGVGYDPEEVTGFAFGMGVERIAMLKYGIDDIRLFFESDLRFLTQF